MDDENLFENERAFYIKLPEEVKDTYIKNCNLKLNIDKQTTYKARMFLTGGLNGSSQCQMVWTGKPVDTQGEITWDIETTTNLGVEKVDYDTNLSLKDVGFNIKKDDKYIKLYSIENNQEKELKETTGDILVSNIKLVDSKEEATEFITDSNGKFNVFGLYAGRYTLEEVSVPYGYTNKMYWNFNGEEETGNQIEVNLSSKPLEETQQIDHNNINQIFKIRNRKQTGNLKIVKKDNKTNQVLRNIGFKLKNSDGKYIKAIDSNGELNRVNGNVVLSNIKYFDNEENGTEFITNESGEINIINIPTGDYQVIETSIGEEYNSYDIDSEFIYWNSNKTNEEDYKLSQAQAVVKVNRQKSDQTDGVGTDSINSLITIKNEKKYIDISGIVWKDLPTGEGKNIILSDGKYNEDMDELFSNEKDRIFAYLVDNTGNVLKDKNGDEYKQEVKNGSYKFEQVKLSELENCKVKFEYNGFEYENVVSDSNVNEELTSKASENTTYRELYNHTFSMVEGNGEKTGITFGGDAQGLGGHDLEYEKDGRTSTLNKIDGGSITGRDYNYKIEMEASTSDNYIINRYNKLSNNGANSISEITYINLGLYERIMPDLSIDQVLYNTKITINGYEHTYLYDNKDINEGEYTGGFNVGVEFGKRYGNGYVQPVYKSDFSTYKKENKDERLKIYLTYAIKVNNLSSGLDAKVHDIVDYYDSNYDIVKIGTKIDENTKEISDEGIIEKEPEIEQGEIYNENNKYKKKIIELPNETIKETNSGIIFIQYKLNDEAAIGMINRNENEPVLKNVVEINSYTIYKNDKEYAGIDKNSNPGNAVPGDEKTYENDTSEGQDVKLSIKQERAILGTVFEDMEENTNNNDGSVHIKEGNGSLDIGEKGISGVMVELLDRDGTPVDILGDNNEKVKSVTTDNDGKYTLKGIDPGEYYIRYTWPSNNKKYNSKDFKATIFNKNTHEDEYWWRSNDSDSDAKDDYNKRIEIDNSVDAKDMESITNKMDIGIEYNDKIKSIDEIEINDEGKVVIPTFNINNINFGIIKRPELNLTIEKRVSRFKMTYLNGQVLTDVQIVENENGKLEPVGTNHGMTYLPNDATNPYGVIRQEIDNEYIQGATMEVTYEVKVKNTSDMDYLNKEFYTYGLKYGDRSEIIKNPVTISPITLTDYLDNEFNYDENLGNDEEKNSDYWKVAEKYEEDKQFDPRGSTVSTSDTGWKLLETITNDKEKYELKRYRRERSEETTEEGYKTYSYRYQKTLTDSTVKDNYKNIRIELQGVNGLEAGEELTRNLYVKKRLTNSEDITFNNESEITEYKIENGKIPNIENIKINDFAEEIVITPSTGGNRNHIRIVVLSVSILLILSTGIVLIKKKVLVK